MTVGCHHQFALPSLAAVEDTGMGFALPLRCLETMGLPSLARRQVQSPTPATARAASRAGYGGAKQCPAKPGLCSARGGEIPEPDTRLPR